MQSGHTELVAVSEMPGVFCQYIHLDPSNFIPTSISPMKVFLSVLWNKTKYNSTIIEASASWSENVTAHGFKACVLVAGRHLNSEFKVLPSIHWTALNFHEGNGNNFLESGIVKLPTWYTGTLCQTINVSGRFRSHAYRAMASISHAHLKDYRNAMTVWTQLYSSRFRICARELQNFDGIHKDVLVVGLFVILVKA